MAGQITPVSGALGAFKIGTTVYQLSRWSLEITLNTGEVLHFDSLQDGANNYWPSTFATFARGEGSCEGKIDGATNIIPIDDSDSVYIGNVGTFACLYSSTNGMTFPGRITGNTLSTDTGDAGLIGLRFQMTGPPTRVSS